MSIYDNEFISGDKVNRPGMGEFYRGSHIKLTEPTRKQKQARGYNSFQGKKNIVGKPVHLPDTTKVHKEWKPIVGPDPYEGVWKPIVGVKASRVELAKGSSTGKLACRPSDTTGCVAGKFWSMSSMSSMPVSSTSTPVSATATGVLVEPTYRLWKAKTAPIPVTTSTPQRSVELTLSEKKVRTIIFILFYIYLCYLFRNTGLAWHRLFG